MINLSDVVPEYQHEIKVIDFVINKACGYLHIYGLSQHGCLINIPFPGYHFAMADYQAAFAKLDELTAKLDSLGGGIH